MVIDQDDVLPDDDKELCELLGVVSRATADRPEGSANAKDSPGPSANPSFGVFLTAQTFATSDTDHSCGRES